MGREIPKQEEEKEEEKEEEAAEEDKKELQSHLVPKEVEARGVDERVRRRTHFYTAPAPPRAHSHCTRSVIFQQTSPPQQNILPNGTGCVLVSVNAVVSFPHF